MATFAGAGLSDAYTTNAVARLAATLKSLPVMAGSFGVDIATLARQASRRFVPLVPEPDRWQIEIDDEDAAWAFEDLEHFADGVAHLLLKHRIPTDADDRERLAVLFDAVDLPRTRLRRLCRRGSPAPDDSDRRHAEALGTALARRNGQQWAQLLATARLYIPLTPTGTSWPVHLPHPEDPGHVIAFTTADGFDHVVGNAASGHVVRLVAELRSEYPGEASLLVDPDLPGGAVVALDEIDELSAGRTTLLAVADLEQQLVNDALHGLRRAVTESLGIAAHPVALAQPWPPDSHVMATLARRNVVVLLDDHGAPRVFGAGTNDNPHVVAAFSSVQVLDRMLPTRPPRRWYRISDLARDWPDGQVLHLDPGTADELVLLDDMVRELPALPAIVTERDDRLQLADELLERAERTPRWQSLSTASGYVLVDPAEIARSDDARESLGELVAAAHPDPAPRPDPAPISAGRRRARPNWWLDELFPRAVLVLLGMFLALILPNPVNAYGPALGAGTAAVLTKLLGRPRVPVGMSIVAVVFAALGTVVLLL
ncbi:hypothetical protein LWC35_19120 [Pseudonocardia kujensis]|uniref:hypothetical protein n=1 Tax=Pseudonocardia kujensis TaxID=1128675 RepID=UPI001E4329AC|nr:hypothetical protein [Pseudonocardia kujensis]MCE0764995.1 hypothetical protein [Pseudonocardia kujensis]